jgi:protein-S-isoprenylcysteine O-methyltransferase Ste14
MSKLQLKRFLKKSYEFSLVLFQFFIIILHFIHLEFIPKKEIMQVNFVFSFVGFLLIIISTIVMLISIKDLGRNLSPFPRPIVNGNLTTSGIYSFIRHPMYYSLILISFGFFITKLSFYHLFLTISLALIIKLKIILEEKYLNKKFKNYFIYTDKVKY